MERIWRESQVHSKKTWRDATAQFHALPAAIRATFRETYQRRYAVLAMWNAERVSMMTGTDGKGDVPGEALQQEFRELAKAGLTPLKILQMTTVEPARLLGRGNFGLISFVVHRGRYEPHSRLNQIVLDLRSNK